VQYFKPYCHAGVKIVLHALDAINRSAYTFSARSNSEHGVLKTPQGSRDDRENHTLAVCRVSLLEIFLVITKSSVVLC
jgi:hypothetical protein